MILQIGAFFSNLLGGVATGLGGIVRQALPGALDIGQAFLQRELQRKLRTREQRRAGAQTVAALNTPGISVARIGGTVQPVGGRVSRSTFTPAATTPAQSPIGNVPLLPVGGAPRVFPPQLNGFGTMVIPSPTLNGRRGMPAGAIGEPRFAKDAMGRTIMFVPAPDGSGFISVSQARALGPGIAMKPFWRFNRLEGQFEKIRPRRMNPFNQRAAARAGRRIERTLDAIKSLVTIKAKMDRGVRAGGKVIKFRTKGRKKKKA